MTALPRPTMATNYKKLASRYAILLREARDALEPFNKAAGRFHPDDEDEFGVGMVVEDALSIGDLRTAKSVSQAIDAALGESADE